jgi:hypothetical protein
MRKSTLAVTALFAFAITTPALAFTEPFPGSYRETRDITCPAQYPVKTGEGTMGGGYITTCWTQQAWNLQMAGGDDWTAWLIGTYVPAPTPTPTVTVTPAPVVIERVVSGGVQEVVREVAAPVPVFNTIKEIKAEIKRLKKQVAQLEKKLKRSTKSKPLNK